MPIQIIKNIGIALLVAALMVTTPAIGDIGGIQHGWTYLRLSGLTTTLVSIKTTPGQLGMLQCGNTNASQMYVQIFDALSGSVTLGSTAPKLSVPIGANSTGGFALPVGITFGTAITIAATTTSGGSTAPGTALDCNVAYN